MKRPDLASVAGTVARLAPGVLGPLLIVAGVALVYLPAAFVALGGFLLAVDRRL